MSEGSRSERSEDRAAERPMGDSSSPDAVGDMRKRISELIDYFGYYVSARIDTLKFAIKRRMLIASWIAIAVLAGAGAIITAVVLLCDGICDGLSVLFGHRWAGELVTGLLLLGVVALGAVVSVRQLIQQSQLKSKTKYEAMRQKEREAFGRDVAAAGGNGDRHD